MRFKYFDPLAFCGGFLATYGFVHHYYFICCLGVAAGITAILSTRERGEK